MRRKTTQILLMCLLICLLHMGCATAIANSQQLGVLDGPQYEWGTMTGQTIKIWGDASDLERTYLRDMFKRYEEKTGNTIIVRGLTKQEMNEELPLTMNTEGMEHPDLLIGHGGTSLENLNPDENFYDFSNALWVSDLSDTSINQTVYNGKIIGLPQGEASISGTLYNKELFEKYKISIPQTQQEFLQVCETLLQNGITPLYLPYAEITMLLYQFPMDSILQNEDTLNALNDGSLSYAQIPEMRKIVEWYQVMAKSGYFGTDYIQNNWDGMSDAMASGKYAMMLCWDTWLYTNYTGDASKFGLMPAFMGVPEEGCFEGPNLMMLIANRNSPQLSAALDFVTFAADPYNYNQTFTGLYTAPIFNTQYGSNSTPQYVESERLIEEYFYDSIAWLRVRGFSQVDATYIQKHMQESGYSAMDCLRDMDAARIERANESLQ